MAKTESTNGILNTSEIMDCIRRYKNGEAEAAEMVVTGNDRLITKLINRHFSTYAGGYFEDMQQEGRAAIVENFTKFNPKLGTFSTFISYFIVGGIRRFLCEDVHNISMHYQQMLKKLNAAVAHFAVHNKVPSHDELAAHMGVKLEALQTIIEIHNKINPVSIDGEDNLANLTNYYLSSPEEVAEKNEQRAALLKAISKRLSPEEQKAIEVMFLSGNGTVLSHKETARVMSGSDKKYSSDEARRIINKAKRSLHNCTSLRQAVGYDGHARVKQGLSEIVVELVQPDEVIDTQVEWMESVDLA